MLRLSTYSENCLCYLTTEGVKRDEVKPRNLEDLIAIMMRLDLDQLWICPGNRLNSLQEKDLSYDQDAYDVRIRMIRNPDGRITFPLPDIAASITFFPRAARASRRPRIIVFPARDTWQWDKYAPCIDAQTALGALFYLQRELGENFYHNPGVIGRLLIKSSVHKRDWLAPAGVDFSWLTSEAGYNLAYSHLPEHLPSFPHLHVWDKNSMYIARCTSLKLPTGTPRHLTGREAQKAADAGCYWGIWHTRGIAGELEPSPVRASQQWISQPILEYLAERTGIPNIDEAWIWPEEQTHALLKKPMYQMWNMRLLFREGGPEFRHDGARGLAEYSAKRIATCSIGLMASSTTKQIAPGFYRPEWRVAIVESAKVALLRQVEAIRARTGALPALIQVDAVGYFSDIPNPYDAFPEFARDGLGGWKLAYSQKLTDQEIRSIWTGQSSGGIMRVLKLRSKGDE